MLFDFFLESNLIEKGFFIFFIIVYGSYYSISLCSFFIIRNYVKRQKYFDHEEMHKSRYLPKIALIGPAYNEGPVVLESVRSLLSVQYFNMELVVVNDGSKDDTLQKLIDEFELEPADIKPYSNIETMPVVNTYKSKNPAFSKLLVVDKVNGRKADAINVGINHSLADYYAVIDLDCILEPDTLLRLVEPVLKERDKKVVAVGGVIGAANDALIRSGKFVKAKSPKDFLPRIQIIEYFRSFILSRPAWSQMNGLLLISGALGLFEREVLIGVNGFTHNSIGEDMNLVMKIHEFCLDRKMDYCIDFIPTPLCWTEVPDNLPMLGNQRNRWMRGTIECMLTFKNMALRPKYGIIGMISYPYWFFAEMMAPLLEFIGFFAVIFFIYTDLLNVRFAIALAILVYIMSVLLSCFSVVVYHLYFNKYNSFKDFWLFIKAAWLEPFIYHPRVLKWSLKGFYDFFIKKSVGWGEMKRTGFNTSKS